jgi:hypothetical protein
VGWVPRVLFPTSAVWRPASRAELCPEAVFRAFQELKGIWDDPPFTQDPGEVLYCLEKGPVVPVEKTFRENVFRVATHNFCYHHNPTPRCWRLLTIAVMCRGIFIRIFLNLEGFLPFSGGVSKKLCFILSFYVRLRLGDLKQKDLERLESLTGSKVFFYRELKKFRSS